MKMPMVILACVSGVAHGSVASSDDWVQSADITPQANGSWVTTIDISGWSTVDLFGDPDNPSFLIEHQQKDDQAPPAPNGNRLIGLGWDITLSTVGSSWASDVRINFGGQLDFSFSQDDSAVTNQRYASGGIIDLPNEGIPPIVFGDGPYAMRVELYESFDDTQNMPEAIFGEGSVITICTEYVSRVVIPTPGVGAVFGVAGILMARRHRGTLA